MAREYPRSYPSAASVQAKREAVAFQAALSRQMFTIAGTQVSDVLGPTLIRTVAEATTGAAQQFFRGLEQVLDQVSTRDWEKLHRSIAVKAQRSTVAAFSRRSPQRDLPAYRAGATDTHKLRYANGALLRAIGASDFFQVSSDRIFFINQGRLNKEAKHWRRLNFGTHGGAALRPPGEFRINWGKTGGGGDLIVAAFGLDPDVRPAFRIPPGLWLEPGVFFPRGELTRTGERVSGVMGATEGAGKDRALKRKRAAIGGRGRRPGRGNYTKGIASTNFLDAGVQRLASEIGPTYWAYFEDVFGIGRGAGVAEQRIQVRVPVLRTHSTFTRNITKPGVTAGGGAGKSLAGAYKMRAGGLPSQTGPTGATYYGSRGGSIARAVFSHFNRPPKVR